MRKTGLLGLLVFVGFLISACNNATTPAKPRFQPYPEEAQILGLTNAFRAQAQTCGNQQFPAAPALTWVEAIGDTAWFHSTDMGAADTENHIAPSTLDRLKNNGFDTDFAAEHRKKTSLPANPNDAFNAWKADPAACADLMNPKFTVMGAGLWGQYEGGTSAYWTQILSAPKGANNTPSLTISPTTATVSVGGAAMVFSATLINSTDTVSFSLTGPGSFTFAGSNATYTPPTTGGAGTATLTATAGALTAKATITINAVPTPTLTVSPTTATVTVGGAAIPFSATLANSADTINWVLTGAGSISSTTGASVNYTPPATGAAGTATLTASAAGLNASATITINAAAPALTVSPTTATTIVGGANVVITASSNQISWSMTGPGTFSFVGSTFTYIPPATGNGGTAVVTATLGALTASATITVSPPLTLSPTATIVTVGGATVSFTASNAPGAVTWSLNGPGNFTSAGNSATYTPPASVGAGPASATLTATSGTLTASATISIFDPQQFLALINQFRSQQETCGTDVMPAVPPLTLESHLTAAAQGHSTDMAINNYFAHNSQNGTTPAQRVVASGYPGSFDGEDIAAGQTTAQGAFDVWRNAPDGHCQSLMSKNATQIGIAVGFNDNSQWKYYWTLDLGKQ